MEMYGETNKQTKKTFGILEIPDAKTRALKPLNRI